MISIDTFFILLVNIVMNFMKIGFMHFLNYSSLNCNPKIVTYLLRIMSAYFLSV